MAADADAAKLAWSMSAITPATSGAAAEVPPIRDVKSGSVTAS